MTVSYKKLWKLLIDKNLKKKDLIRMSGISNYTLNSVKFFTGCLRVRTPLFLCLKYP